ncbi:MAG TPA: carboxypeptidase-like regulatory domain-containing protein [Polyangia bacterium]|jgi:hypothetical protein
MSRRPGLVLLLAAALLGCGRGRPPGGGAAPPGVAAAPGPASAPAPSLLTGTVADDGEPAAGAMVQLYRDLALGLDAVPAFTTGPTGLDGTFRLAVPPGTYYLVARVGAGPGAPLAYFGGNPVHLEAGRARTEHLVLVRPRAPAPDLRPRAAGATLVGELHAGSRPLPGVTVAALDRPAPAGVAPPRYAARTDAAGRFELAVPPGRYYLVGAEQRRGRAFGQLEPGDHFCFHPGNPVEVPAHGVRVVALPCAPGPAAPPVVRASRTFVFGTTVDDEGRPLAGVTVGALMGPDLAAPPRHRSTPSAADGRFELEVVPGRYHLVARTAFGGPPLSGELLGLGPEPTLAAGARLTGVTIVVQPVP